MARKPKRSKTEPSPDDSGGLPKPALVGGLGFVLLCVGLAIGVALDVTFREEDEPALVRSPAVTERDRPASDRRPAPAPEASSRIARSTDLPPAVPETPTVQGLDPMSLYAVPVTVPENWRVVAIVIDDMGPDLTRAMDAIGLPGPLTLSFLTYAEGLPGLSESARIAGHEIMAHVPMEPLGPADPGPGALTTGATPGEIRARLDAYLSHWEGFVGINNHMGSRFTADRRAMDVVMGELKNRGLLWLDSRTTADTAGEAAAEALGVPHLGRDVFLDNEDNQSYIAGQLAKVEAVAKEQGTAVAIGHPRDATIAALAAWLPTLEEKKITLVPVTEVYRRRMADGATAGLVP